VQQIQTQIQVDKDILVVMLVLIQVLAGLVLVVAEVLAVLVLLEMLLQEVLMQTPLAAVVESVFNFHQPSMIQLLQ
jgi:hypothetical protein